MHMLLDWRLTCCACLVPTDKNLDDKEAAEIKFKEIGEVRYVVNMLACGYGRVLNW
jgi:hypothetical protein